MMSAVTQSESKYSSDHSQYSLRKNYLGPRIKMDSFQHVLCGLVSILLAFCFFFFQRDEYILLSKMFLL